MAVQLNHVYIIGIVIPKVLNNPSLAKFAAGLGPLQTVDVEASMNPWQIQRYFCIFLQYDPLTKIGVMLLGTSQPQQAHRFVPCKGATRLPYQPRHEVCLSPPSGLSNTGYFNFSHALRATIIVEGDAILPTFPHQAFLTEEFSDGTNIDVFLSPYEVNCLKNLHGHYWEGLRYNNDGFLIFGGSQGLGGGPSRGVGGPLGRAGETSGVASGTSEESGRVSRGIGGAPHFRPIGTDGTINLTHYPTVEGGSGAERLARALLEEDERMLQLDLVAGEHPNPDAPDVLAFVQPFTMKALEVLDAF